MSDKEENVVELKDIMKQLEDAGQIPDGFVMIYMLADPSEVEDGTQTDFFFKAFATKRDLFHKKTVLMYEDTPVVRHEIAWFGEWDKMGKIIEMTEAEVMTNLTRFFSDDSLNVMPRMDFMFVNQRIEEEESEPSEDDDLFQVCVMQIRLELGEGKWLVFEDYGEKRKHLKVSIEDATNVKVVLGICLKDEFKRAGRSV